MQKVQKVITETGPSLPVVGYPFFEKFILTYTSYPGTNITSAIYPISSRSIAWGTWYITLESAAPCGSP